MRGPMLVIQTHAFCHMIVASKVLKVLVFVFVPVFQPFASMVAAKPRNLIKDITISRDHNKRVSME